MTVKTLDLSKFRKDITKNIPGLSVGFRDPKVWISTGNYALNYAISGKFKEGGIPLGKVTILGGASGSGKSFLASGNITSNAQKKDVFVVLIDTENALDEKWLHALDVDTSDEKLLKLNMAMIDEVAKLISDFMKDYKARYGVLDEAERPRVLFVIDSLGMLMTPTDVNQFEAGDLKGDMGRKPKALAALVRNCVNMFGEYDVGMVCTNHSYASQDMFNPDDVISGGQGQIFAASIVVATRKLKLKEDDQGNKTTDVKGIRAQCKVMKTRFNQPFTEVELKIPYDRGMDPYSGLFDLFVKKQLLIKEGNKWIYNKLDGGQIKQFEKAWSRNEDDCLEIVMAEFDSKLKYSKSSHVDADAEDVPHE
jgi:RecA/RadA recombinase